jgi:hypothetical protein
MFPPIAQGYHCDWIGGARTRAVAFPQVVDQVNTLEIPDFVESGLLDFGSDENPRPQSQWWTVELWGFTLYDTLNLPDLTRLQFSSFERAWLANPAAAGPGQRTTPLQARVFYSNNSSRHRWVDVDIGTGCRFSVLTDKVQVYILAPQGSRQLVEGGNTVGLTGGVEPPEGGTVSMSMLAGTVTPTPSAIGSGGATYSRTVIVPAGQQLVLPHPPAARRVAIYQAGGFRTPLQWGFLPFAPTPLVGNVGIGGANAPIGEGLSIPQSSASLVVPSGLAARTLTLRYALEL